MVNYRLYGLTQPILADSDDIRIQIPGSSAAKLKFSMVFKFLKDLIGKDLSKFSIPIIVNEPCCVL